ncbi:hypothetical protein F511_13881 [Dorcoceras hygrometricum]|uniref:Uncharacterized protein n=1 Tax=Dorcoceras hygrometricum TaxID=472368 RepID=A0A2Z7BCX0_9LAMI|nr:hypothetical protein F511_13881 [Dorcoceras hygrometricum]
MSYSYHMMIKYEEKLSSDVARIQTSVSDALYYVQEPEFQTGNTTTEGSGRDLKKRRKDKSVGVARSAGALREKMDQLENSVLAVEQEMSDEKKSDSEAETTEAQSAVEKEKSVSSKREEM